MSLPFTLESVRKVTFFKRDEITTDLICCDVEVGDENGTNFWFNYEESDSWTAWVEALSALPGFDQDWYAKVYLPPFDSSLTVAYESLRLNPLS